MNRPGSGIISSGRPATNVVEAAHDEQLSDSLSNVRSRTLRIGLVQSQSAIGSAEYDPRDANLGRALEAIDELADRGAQLAVFGEMYLSGYRTDGALARWGTSVAPADAHVKALLAIAKRRNIHVIMGAATFGNFMPGEIYNSAIFLGPSGLVGTYRKTHVAAFPYQRDDRVCNELSFYRPGKDLPVFETPIGRIGIQICYDVCFPEVTRVLALKGAEVIVNVAASSAGFEEYWDHVVYVRAAENATWFAVCSVVGEQKSDTMFGGSRVVDPSGSSIAQAKYNEEDRIICDIDLMQTRLSRAALHLFAGRQPELYETISQPTPYP